MAEFEFRGTDFTYNQLTKNELEAHIKEFANLSDEGFKVKRSKNKEVLPKSALYQLASNVFFERVHRHIKDNRSFGYSKEFLKGRLGSNYASIIQILFEVDHNYKSYTKKITDKTYTKQYRLKPIVDEIFRKCNVEYWGRHKLLDKFGKVWDNDGFLRQNPINKYVLIDNERSKSIKSMAYQKELTIPTLVPINMDHLYWGLKAYGQLTQYSDGLPIDSEILKVLKSSGIDFAKLKPKNANTKIKTDIWFKTLCAINTITHTDPIPYGSVVQKYNEISSGRLYTEGNFGIQNWPKHIRHLLLSGMNYYDYDFVSCHFNTLEQLNTHYGGKHLAAVSEYNQNVTNIRNQIAKDCGIPLPNAKKLMLAIVYGASINSKVVLNRDPKSKRMRKPSDLWLNCLELSYGDEAYANQIWENITKNEMIRDLHKDVKKASKTILNNAVTKGKGKREYIKNHYDRWLGKYQTIGGKVFERTPSQLLSHMLCGMEAFMVSEVALTLNNANSTLFIANFHDGFISNGQIDKEHYEEIIYTATQKRLTEYDGKLADKGIVMKIDGGALNDPFKSNGVKPQIRSTKEADLPFDQFLPN